MANLNEQPLINPVTNPITNPVDDLVDITTLMPILGQLTLGGFLGFATGYAIKKVSKVLILVIGILFILVQLATSQGYINIDWLKIQSELNPFFEPDTINHGWRSFINKMTSDLPFTGGFITMLIIGLKQG